MFGVSCVFAARIGFDLKLASQIEIFCLNLLKRGLLLGQIKLSLIADIPQIVESLLTLLNLLTDLNAILLESLLS